MRKASVVRVAATFATISGVSLMWNFGIPQSVLACGPFSKMAVFSHSTHPDYPFTKFAQGELGIVQPTFARSYLVVAYRYLSGLKTPPEKQKEFVALWNRRISPPGDGLANAVKAWLAQRKQVASVPFKVTEDYEWNNWKDGYINYPNRAFYSAADALKSKITRYGAADSRVTHWVRAQDQVFAGANLQNLEGAEAQPPLAELPASADKELIADRAYQLASKDFYDGKFADAATKFQAIAKDSSSRWQKWGLYLAARSLCRKATTGEAIDLGELDNAQKLVDEILKSKELDSMHSNAEHLGHFIQYRTDPESRVKALAKELAGPGENVDFDEALGDYTCLLDHFFVRPEGGEEEPTAWKGGAGTGSPLSSGGASGVAPRLVGEGSGGLATSVATGGHGGGTPLSSGGAGGEGPRLVGEGSGGLATSVATGGHDGGTPLASGGSSGGSLLPRDDSRNETDFPYTNCALIVVALGLCGLIGMSTARDGFKRDRIVSVLALSSLLLSMGTVACSSSNQTPKPDGGTPKVTTVSNETLATTQVAQATNQPTVVLDDDMSVWISNFIDRKPEATDMALKKWQETKSLHWLVSAISKLKPSSPNSQGVLAEAAKIGADSPAYLTVAYHRARLAKETGASSKDGAGGTDGGSGKDGAGSSNQAGKGAVPIIKQALGLPPAKLPPSAKNLLLKQQLELCSSLDEFAKTASPSPATIAWDYDVVELPEPESDLSRANKTGNYLVYPGCLTDDAACIINTQLPLSAIVKLAGNPALPQNVRMNLAQAGWVRSVLLKNDKTAMALLPVLATLNPSLKAGLEAYKNAAPADKEFAAISLILHNPAMQPYARAGLQRETPFNKIDNYRDNWWCDKAPATYGYDPEAEEGKPEPKGRNLAFLTAEEKKSGQAEYSALKELGTAPNLLAKKVVDYAKAHPKDSKLPEVLHLAVTATRYGCTDDETTTYSKAAYQALHKNFPGNPWTKKTKHWF